MKRLAILTVMALAMSACLGGDFEDSVDGAWQLESGRWAGEDVPILADHPITLSIDGDHFGGTAACNGYGGSVVVDGSSITLGEFAITEMACMPAEVMGAERIYMGALQTVDTVALDEEGRLVLTSEETELVFGLLEPVPTAHLLGTVWVLDGLVEGDAVSSVLGERATLELFNDGSFIGSTGCRDISGSYVVTGATVQFTEFSAEGECPDDLAAQDSHVISALESGFRVEIEEDRMTTWVSGDMGLTYRGES